MIDPLLIFFTIFSAGLIGCSGFVAFSKNAVYSVLALILAFVNGAGLFLLARSEFLAMVLVIVYVGAVAVLFLFVVMMLDFKTAKLKNALKSHKLGAIVVTSLFAGELSLMGLTWARIPQGGEFVAHSAPHNVTNTQGLGEILYTHFFLQFQLGGVILLTAMIGAIVLVIGVGRVSKSKRQDVSLQNKRSPHHTLELVHVTSGGGVKPGKIEKEKAHD
jgi:NADH-quinone oxidoreductase subunit J